MSVGTLVTFRNAELRTEYLPLASEIAFRSFWLPLARSQNLKWFPLFESGVSLPLDAIPEVLEEVLKLQQAIGVASFPAKQRAEMMKRAELLKSLLKNLNLEEVKEIFIG
jgi:ABC-type uncharacterized transport system permease subunit